MAWDETMGSGLRQGMCYLSTKQNYYSSSENLTLPYHYRTRSAPFPASLYGPYHWFTPCPGPRRNTNHCRPRVLPKCHIPTLFYRHHRSRDCPTISRTRVPVVWTPNETNHRPRPSLHLTFRQGTNHASGHSTKPIYSLSPPN